jgi:NAD(P)-dependent dehydrogenase (short-subunit alcohol dehydrogenase family)
MGFFQEWLSIVTTLFRKPVKAIEPLPPNTSFAGKSIIVTGATSGLGLEAAIIYVQLGAETVYITSRNAARGTEAKATIEERTGKTNVVKVLVLDLDTFDGVKQFVGVLKKEVKSIGMQFLPFHHC